MAGCALGLALSGCSVNLLSDDLDRAISEQPGYRDVHFQCNGLRLDSVEMNVPTFRSMVSCFNADGKLREIEAFVKALSDDDVQAVVDVGNKYFFKDAKMLYQFNRTYRMLEANGTLDEAFRQFGRVAENEEFVATGIALLKEKYFADKDLKLLKALERLSTRLDPQDAGRALDLMLSMLDSKAFAGLQQRFRGDSPTGRELRPLVEGLLAYMRDIRDPGHIDAGKQFLQAIVDHRLLETLDTVTGTSPEAFKIQVPRMTSVLSVSLAQNARVMDGMTSLFHYLNRPISCLQGSQQVPNGVMHVMRELSEHNATDASSFIKRTTGMSLVGMNGMCEYPAELGQYYPAMIALADTNAMEPAADLLKAFYGYRAPDHSRPLISLLVNTLADTGSGGLLAGAENTSGIKHVLPILAELHDRGAFPEILLGAALLPDSERVRLKDTVSFLLAPTAELGGQSIYDVLMDSVMATRPGQLYDFVRSLRRFTESDEPVLVPAIRVLRAAYYVNDVHPILDLARAVLADAGKNRFFFEALLRISEKTELRDALRLTSQMAQNGRLRELMGVVVQIYDRFAQAGVSPVNPVVEPPFVPQRRHNLAAADLTPFPIVRDPNADTDPCGKLDPNVSLLNPKDPKFDAQVTNLVGCLNRDGAYGGVAQAVSFLRTAKIEDGRSYFDLGVGLLNSLGFSTREDGFLARSFMSAIDDGRMFRLLGAIPMWITGSYPGSADGGDAGTVVEALFGMLKPIAMSGKDQVRRLETYGARALRRDDAAKVLRFVDDVTQNQPEPTPAGSVAYDLPRYQKWAQALECRTANDAANRAVELAREFENTVTSWDLVNGRPRTGWTLADFKAGISPIFDYMAQPHANDPNPAKPNVRVADVMLGFMRYFTLAPGQKRNRWQHYAPEYLMQWFKERSNDYRPILYYYPGEESPRVKLVNSLDRLDLSLINSDFEAPLIGTNYGLKFLAMIAEAWGDEPYEIWPDEIKAKYPNGKGVLTLAQAVKEMHSQQESSEGLVGFPTFPNCLKQVPGEAPIRDGGGWLPFVGDIKPRLFNNAQVLPVLDENAANGGLKVLRDLFFDVYYSTPEDNRKDSGDKNHLNVILKSVRMGVFRQIGRSVLSTPPADPATNDLFRGVVLGSLSPEMAPLVKTLVVDDLRRDLFWKLTTQVFSVLDGDPRGKAYFMQTLQYLMAAGGQLNLIDPFLRSTRAVLAQHRDFLLANAPKIRTLLVNADASYFTRSLYEHPDADGKQHLADLLRDALSDPARAVDLFTLVKLISLDNDTNKHWDRFWNRADALRATSAYQNLRIGEITRQILDFLEEKSADPAGVAAAQRLRVYTAERLESRELDPFLFGAGQNPNEFYQVLSTFSHEIENGDIRRLLELARRSLIDRP